MAFSTNQLVTMAFLTIVGENENFTHSWQVGGNSEVIFAAVRVYASS